MDRLFRTALALTVMGVSGAAQSLSGTWRMVSARETVTPPPEVAYDDWDDNGIEITIINGPSPAKAKLNGRFYAVKGDPDVDAVAARRRGERTLILRFRKNHKVVTSEREVSNDGQTMIVRDAGVGENGPVDSVSIWRRVSAEGGSHPYIGRWREDYIELTLKHLPVYHLEFNGDEVLATSTAGLNVIAKADGKPYPQKDGTVAEVKRLDDHALEITDKQGETLNWLLHFEVDHSGGHATLDWVPPSTIEGKQRKTTTALVRMK